MADYYYDIQYIEYENDDLKSTDRLLFRSTSPASHDDMKNFIRNRINRHAADLTLASVNQISEETYTSLGGTKVPPWSGRPF
jgi:hypothetical protein